MQFRLINKKLGVKSISIFSEFSYPENIKDICYIKDIGFLCLCDNSIIKVTDQECNQVISIDNPMSICKGSEGHVYVSYQNGIRDFNYLDGYYHSELFGNEELENIYKPLKKIGVSGIYVHALGNTVGLSISPLNKVYVIRKGSVYKQYGSGLPTYGLSSSMQLNSFYNPCGVLMYNESTVFVSDTMNGCIRSLGDSHRIIVGNPLAPTIYPTKLLISNKKDILYYLSKNYLRSVTVSDSKDAMLYENEHILSMSMVDDKIYVLEGI